MVSRDAESSERSAWRGDAVRAPLRRLRVAANPSRQGRLGGGEFFAASSIAALFDECAGMGKSGAVAEQAKGAHDPLSGKAAIRSLHCTRSTASTPLYFLCPRVPQG